jgi:hypothetical protein
VYIKWCLCAHKNDKFIINYKFWILSFEFWIIKLKLYMNYFYNSYNIIILTIELFYYYYYIYINMSLVITIVNYYNKKLIFNKYIISLKILIIFSIILISSTTSSLCNIIILFFNYKVITNNVEICFNFLGYRWHPTYRWKVVDKGYNFPSNFTLIIGLHTKLWASKVVIVPILRILGLFQFW